MESGPKHIKPTFDMLFSKYSRQKAGINSNRPYLGKRLRSPSGEETSRNFRPARPEKSMAEKAPARDPKGKEAQQYPHSAGGIRYAQSARELFPAKDAKGNAVWQPVRSRLVFPNIPEKSQSSIATNIPEKSQSSVAANMPEKSHAGSDSINIGTQVVTMRQSATSNSDGKGPILTIAPRSAANDHEASSSRGPPPPKEKKPVDPKYTQPVWCPPGLTKTQKRKLQRLRNQDRAEKEAERLRDKRFEITHPRVLS